MNDLKVIRLNGKLVTDSREVAEMIGKPHDQLMRSIRGYINILDHSAKLQTADFFIESNYKNENNQSYPCYLLTKQGCEMVGNKMTGKKGILFTAEYVQAFNQMEKFTQSNFSLSEFKSQMTTLVNNLFDEKLSETKEYYKIKAKSKADISTYIKKRLGILRVDGEYEQVKTRIFLLLNIAKWEDLNIDNLKSIMPVIDESIRVVKMDRPQQVSLW